MKRITRKLRFLGKHNRLTLFWLLAIIGLLAPWLWKVFQSEITTTRECTVSSIYDGDTMRVKCDGDQVKVRLYCIDAPEMGQRPWGRVSRDYLRGLAPRGARVQIKEHKKDKYGRLVGEVINNRKNLNLVMVRAGQAAVYRQYCKYREYAVAEDSAKNSSVGIWRKFGDHQRPWRWRHK